MSYSGDNLDIGFNARYLLEIAQQIEGDVIQMALSDLAHQALFQRQGMIIIYLC